LVYLLGEYATEWALVRGTSDCGVLNEKRTHPNTNIEGPNYPNGISVLSVVVLTPRRALNQGG
jgi:hypothetical protein